MTTSVHIGCESERRSLNRGQRLLLGALLVVGVTPFLFNGYYNPMLAASPPLFWAVDTIVWVAVPVAVYAVGRAVGLFVPAELGFRRTLRGLKPHWLLPLTLGFTILAFWLDRVVVQWAVAHLPTAGFASHFKYGDMIPPPGPETGWLRLGAMLLMSLEAGIVQELYYRGMLRRLFADSFGATIAFIMTSTLLFSAVHWEGGWVVLVEAAVFGCMAAVAYSATGNLWPLIVAHFTIDLLWFVRP